MEFIKQISVFVENKSGRLSEIVTAIGSNGIDISAMSIADTTDFGILRMIVNDPDKACAVLKESGVAVKVTDVIALGVNDVPGGLAKELEILKNAGVGIDYMYAFRGKQAQAMIILKVDDPEQAVKALENTDAEIVAPENIYNM